MDDIHDVCDDLRRVGALKRDRLGGRPSDNALSKLRGVGLARDTVGAWLSGRRFPSRLDALLILIGEIRAEASRAGALGEHVEGASGDTVADLLAEHRWRDAWNAEQQRRARKGQQAAERQRARAMLTREELRARQAALADRPRPVRAWTAKRLGVHPAIPGDPFGGHGSAFVLPRYVPRPHDEELRRHLRAAAADGADPVLVVVRGESCTGKTRTAYEALRAAVPDDVDLIFPADADGLLAILAADALGPRTVLWLNDARAYLADPAGEAVAAALLRRLDGQGPLIVIATLWPEHEAVLTSVPVRGGDDPHRHARMLLAQAHRVHVPRSFTGHLDTVRGTAGHDRSLAAALEASGANLTQALAAGPDLVGHFEHPTAPHGPYGKALMAVAMDAHRLGVNGPLPLPFLEAAAPGYLTGDERVAAGGDTWFADALEYARTLIKHTTRPLQEVPRPSGMGALPGVVRLADYLQQHGRRTRGVLFPPASFWEAAATHLTNPDDLVRLASAAHQRQRYRVAASLYCTAAQAGHVDALMALLRMRRHAGETEGTEPYYRAAARAGDRAALMDLAFIREAAGDRAEAERLHRAAVKAGAFRIATLPRMREAAGDHEGAERLAFEAADEGRTGFLMELGRMRRKAGDDEGAERLFRAAAEAGDPSALTALASMRETAEDWEEAERLYSAGGNEDHFLLEARVRVREKAGDHQGAEELAFRTAGMSYGVLHTLVEMRESAGRGAEAERLAHRAAANGNPFVLAGLARLREEAGNSAGAGRLYQAAADAGDLAAMSGLVRIHERTGSFAEAERLARRAAEDGDASVLDELAQMRKEAGNRADAERLYGAAAESGYPAAWAHAARLREEAGDLVEAERLYRVGASAGDADAAAELARIRERAGDPVEADRFAHRAADGGRPGGLRAVVLMREESGDREGAERLALDAACAGRVYPLTELALERERAGDGQNAMRLHVAVANSQGGYVLGHMASATGRPRDAFDRYGLEPDGTLSDPWPWPEPGDLGSDH